jgi:hypothetical protein
MENDERFFSERFTPTNMQEWNKWYQDYRKYVLKIPKEYKPKFNNYRR